MNPIIYGNGYIANRLKEDNGWEISDHRVKTIDALVQDMEDKHATHAINAIGGIGKNNVDECDSMKDEVLYKNSLIPLIMAEACRITKIPMLHYSTGCMFDMSKKEHGFRTVHEFDKPNFDKLFYSRTKAYSDGAIDYLSQFQPITQIRFRVPIDNRPHPRNLIDKLKKYKKVIDTTQSITWIPDLTRVSRQLLEGKNYGTYHVATREPISYVELMNECKRHDPSIEFEVIDEKDLNLVRTNVTMASCKLPYHVTTRLELLLDKLKEYYKK